MVQQDVKREPQKQYRDHGSGLALSLVASTDVWGFGKAVDDDGHRVVPLRNCRETGKGEPTTMADTLSMALTKLLRKADAEPDLDPLREGVRS